MNRYFTAFVFLFVLLPAGSALASDRTSDSADGISLTPCHVDNIRRAVLCGSYDVPVNYDEPQENQISLNIVVLPAVDSSSDNTPMMFLAGGPGQAATEIAALVRRSHSEVIKTRDIILVDQRGTGKSATLECDTFDSADAYSILNVDVNIAEQVTDCISQIDQDLSQFSSENAMRDIDQVRAALGHEKINLYGGSYGTRAAQVYMRLFPDTLENVVLDSVGPLEVPIGLFGQSSARSFSLLEQECAASASCKSAFPELRAEFDALAERLLANPVDIEILHPRLATPTQLRIDKEKLIGTLRLRLYSSGGRALLPFVISQAYNENYLPLAGLISQTEFGIGVYYPVTFNILCSEDIPRASAGMFDADANNNFGQNMSHLSFTPVCEHWPRYPVSEAFSQPITADIPTLILSGNLDPVTPPSNGDVADASLPNSQHIVAPNVSHIVAGKGCADELIAEFLDTGDPQSIDGSCLQEIPATPFVTSVNGSL